MGYLAAGHPTTTDRTRSIGTEDMDEENPNNHTGRLPRESPGRLKKRSSASCLGDRVGIRVCVSDKGGRIGRVGRVDFP